MKYAWNTNLLPMCGPSFSFVGLSVPEKREMKLFDIWKLERKKSEEIKGRISRRCLVLFHIKITNDSQHLYQITKFYVQ